MNTEPRTPTNEQKDPAGTSMRRSSMSDRVSVLHGEVELVHRGLTRIAIRLRVGRQTRVRVRRPADVDDGLPCQVGQGATVQISDEAISIEPGTFRQGRRRWNRWLGRVVLVERDGTRVHVSVKVQGDDIVLRKSYPVEDSCASLRTWDIVNLVVDPSRIGLHFLPHRGALQDAGMRSRLWHPQWDAHVWLQARLGAVQQLEKGYLLSLDLGATLIAAHVLSTDCRSVKWTPGRFLRIQVGVWEAHIDPCTIGAEPVPCQLLHLTDATSKASRM
ncbi:hypothetical protein YTPLAS18_14730 [Nitrospira sp.]|nr:hypothetical protein YTPLAS18_14730 [Nitrospira sp.]